MSNDEAHPVGKAVSVSGGIAEYVVVSVAGITPCVPGVPVEMNLGPFSLIQVWQPPRVCDESERQENRQRQALGGGRKSSVCMRSVRVCARGGGSFVPRAGAAAPSSFSHYSSDPRMFPTPPTARA